MAIKRKVKVFLVVLSVLSLLILIIFIGIRYYINNNKKEIIAIVERVINENRKGQIIFDSINISSYKELPNIELQISNFALVDSLYSKHKRKTVFFKEVNAAISVIDLLKDELIIKSILVKNGQINIFVDKDHYTNTYVFGSNDKNENNESDIRIIGNDVDITLENIDFIQTEKIKNKRIAAHVNSIDFNIDFEKFVIPKLNLDIFMKEMGFNLDKGTFFNKVKCVGTLYPKIDRVKKTIEVPNFQLHIGEQEFDVSAFFNIKDKNFNFLLSLDKANYKETLALLSANIKSKLAQLNILKPIKVKAEISGIFKYRNKPVVELEYSTQNNEIIFNKDSIRLKNVTFSGTFKNRIYDDDRQKTENPKNFTNHFEKFTGLYKNMPFQLSQFTLNNEFSKPIHLKTDYKIEGEVKDLDDLINSKNYKFTNGKFSARGNYNDYISTLSDAFKFSMASIESSNLLIKNKHNTNQFSLPHLALEINKDNAEIKDLVIKINTNESAQVKGTIKNFSTMFVEDDHSKPIFSTLNISSDYIKYSSLLMSFGARRNQTQSKNLADVKYSLNTLAKRFNPKLNLSVQNLNFSGSQFKNIKLEARYKRGTFNILEISGNYKDGKAKAKLKIDLNPRKNTANEETVFLDLLLEVNGKIEHWAEILHSEKFFFRDADYNLIVNLSNEVNELKDLVEESKIIFKVQKGSMVYKPSGLTLPFNNIALSMQNKNAYLQDFELQLPNNQTVHLKGELNNFIDLFSNTNSTNNVKSSILVSSKNIDFSNFVDAFNPDFKKTSEQNNVKIILKDLYTKFHPSVSLQIDNLSYKNVSLQRVNANMSFKDLNTLNFNNVYFDYFNKKVALDAQFNLSHATQTSFKTNVTLDDLAIENILKTFNNFGYAQLDQPTELTGIFDATASFKGDIDDTDGVEYSTIEANLDYNIKELRVKYFKPLIDAGNLVFRKERFEDIKFANINGALSVKNNIISLPQTNVQSTAFDFFIEGDIENSIYTNLWVSIPLSNMKRRDLTKIPSKKTFDEANKKIYLEIKADKNGKLHHKLQLSNKKHLRVTQ